MEIAITTSVVAGAATLIAAMFRYGPGTKNGANETTIGKSFVRRETCAATHAPITKQLDRIEGKLDELLTARQE